MTTELVQIHGADEISQRIGVVGAEISRDYDGQEFVVLGVLEDGFVFLADLLRAVRGPVRTAFLRYRHEFHGGIRDISFSAQIDIKGQHVLLVEAVLGTGVPQDYLIKQLGSHGAASVKLCVLIDKPDRRRIDVRPDYRVFEASADYVFGYGLGFQDRYRELPFLATFGGSDG